MTKLLDQNKNKKSVVYCFYAIKTLKNFMRCLDISVVDVTFYTHNNDHTMKLKKTAFTNAFTLNGVR